MTSWRDYALRFTKMPAGLQAYGSRPVHTGELIDRPEATCLFCGHEIAAGNATHAFPSLTSLRLAELMLLFGKPLPR
jgi:hypothetical protein